MNLDYFRSFCASWLEGVALVGLVFLVGCSFVSVDQQTRYRDAEGYFEPRLLEQIKTGETTHTWVVEHFGRPWYREVDALADYPADVQINTWRFEREQQKNTRVLLLFRSRKLNQQYEYLHVVSEGDRVMRAWRDASETVDTRRLMAAMGYAKAGLDKEPAPLTAPTPLSQNGESAIQRVPPAAALTVEDVAPAAGSRSSAPSTQSSSVTKESADSAARPLGPADPGYTL